MPQTTTLMVPTVHLNGTSKRELLEQLEHAHLAVNKAMTELSKASPNARDYYVQSNVHAFSKAVDEHCDRMKRLKSVLDELEEIAEALPI